MLPARIHGIVTAAPLVVDDDRSGEEVRQPAATLGEQHRDEAGEQRHDREHEPDQTNEGATDRRGAAVRAVNADAQQPHPRCLSRRAPEEDEVRGRDQRPAGAEQGTGQPRRAQAADQRRDQRSDACHRQEENESQGCIGRQRDRPRHDPAVDRRRVRGRRRTTLLDTVVEPSGGCTDAADHFLCKPGRLACDRVSKFGARGDVVHGALRLVARKHAVGELECLGVPESSGHEALQLAALRELRHDAIEHAVAHERACELLRKRSGERLVEHTGNLGRRRAPRR